MAMSVRTADLDLIIDAGAKVKYAEAARDALRVEVEAKLRQAAEADANVRELREKLKRLVEEAQRSDDAIEASEAEAARRTVTDQVKEWFEAHPAEVVRAGDLVDFGIGKDANSLRSTLHRLIGEEFLAQPGAGLFKLAVSRELGDQEAERKKSQAEERRLAAERARKAAEDLLKEEFRKREEERERKRAEKRKEDARSAAE
jgi:hypothetical protein